MKVLRLPWGETFTYRDKRGDTLRDKALREWIESIAIPPAWRDVEIDSNPDAKVVVTGRDDAGRKQYIYSERWREQQNKRKYDRIIRFAGQLATMRRITGQHLKHSDLTREKVLACMVRLIDTAYFRPGNSRYTEENESYGLTTLRARHLQIEGDELIFRYRGKAGVDQKKTVDDSQLKRIVQELNEVPGYEIFKYFDTDGNKVNVDSQDLNQYIHEVMGEDFSAKDFRTWAGTSLAALSLDEFGIADKLEVSQQNVRNAVDAVASRLGNTPEVTRSSYIDPRVIKHYLDGKTLKYFMQEITEELDEPMFSAEESAVLKLLEYK